MLALCGACGGVLESSTLIFALGSVIPLTKVALTYFRAKVLKR